MDNKVKKFEEFTNKIDVDNEIKNERIEKILSKPVGLDLIENKLTGEIDMRRYGKDTK